MWWKQLSKEKAATPGGEESMTLRLRECPAMPAMEPSLTISRHVFGKNTTIARTLPLLVERC